VKLDILDIACNDGSENISILQGGGSLEAFGCGVFKAFAESRVMIDIHAEEIYRGSKCCNYCWQ